MTSTRPGASARRLSISHAAAAVPATRILGYSASRFEAHDARRLAETLQCCETAVDHFPTAREETAIVPQNNYDAIVVGAGHNGLTNATYLARSGLKVLLLERNPWIGGAAVSREIEKGWTYSNCSYVCSLLRPEIFRDLELARHGLQVVPYGGGVTITSSGDILGNYTDDEVQRREFARHNARDADAYDRYSTEVMRQCKFIRPLLLRTPPDPTSLKPRDIREMIFLSKEFKKLGEQVIYDTMRFYSMSIADYLGEYFESDLIKARLSGSGIIGTALGVYSPGTAYVLLHHYMGDVDGSIGAWGFARGGMGAVSKALANAFKSFGGEIVTDADVKQRARQRQRVTGVVCANGNEYRAKIVVSNLDPQAHVHQAVRSEGPAARVRQAREELQDPRLLGKAEHRARRAAGVPGARQGQPAALRRHALPRLAREDRARLRRLEERHLVEGAVPRPADSVDDRPDDGARRASTSCRCSCSTCRRRSTAATGPTRTATASRTRCSTRSGATAPTSNR